MLAVLNTFLSGKIRNEFSVLSLADSIISSNLPFSAKELKMSHNLFCNISPKTAKSLQVDIDFVRFFLFTIQLQANSTSNEIRSSA